MSGNFSFPPPPPPPPRQAANGPHQRYPQQQQARGGRGGQQFNSRGRGAPRGRGNFGGEHHGYSNQQNSFGAPPPYEAQWGNDVNNWAAQQAQHMMAVYGMPNGPAYAQSLPGYSPNAFAQPNYQAGPTRNQYDIRPASPANPQNNQQQGGVKRKREVNPRVPAPTPVPSFGGSIPHWRPQSTVSGVSVKPEVHSNDSPNRPGKKPKKNNQLGLTPGGEQQQDSEDDVDEEAKFAKTNSDGPIIVVHGNDTVVLASAADIKAWVDERKKKWPTKARAEEKRQEEAKLQEERNEMNRQIKEARRKEHEANKRKKDEKKSQNNAQNSQLSKKQQKAAHRGQRANGQDNVQLSNEPAQNTNIRQQPHSQTVMERRRLYIGNLAYAATEADLLEFFKDFQPQVCSIHRADVELMSTSSESASIPSNPRTERPVGYAFLDIATPQDAERAVQELDQKPLLERPISAQLAKLSPESDRSMQTEAVYSSTVPTAIQPRVHEPTQAEKDLAVSLAATKPASDVPKDANDKSAESLRPSEQQPNKLARLQARAEKYRKLAEEAEIAALEAKAKSLGYALVKSKHALHVSVNTAAPFPVVGGEDEHGKADLSASDLPSSNGNHHEQAPKVEADTPTSKIEEQATQPSAIQSASQPLPGLSSQVDALIAEEAARAALPELPVPQELSDNASDALFTVDIAGDQAFKIEDANGDMAKSLHAIYSPGASRSGSDSDSPLSSSDSSRDSSRETDSAEAGEIESEVEPKPKANVEPRTAAFNPELAARSAPQNQQNKKPCNIMMKFGNCKYGDQCRFSHDLSQPQPNKMKKQEKSEKRVTLRERLLQSENDERNKLILDAIKFLGDKGILDEQAGEKVAESTHAVDAA